MKPLNHRLIYTIALSTTVGAFLIVLFRSLAIVPAGHVGVVDSFGEVNKQTLKPGINLVNPLAQVEIYSTRTQEIKETLEAPSKEGLLLTLDVSLLYHLDAAKAQQVYQTIGNNYQQVVLLPQFRSVVRQVTASYEAKGLYTSQRQQISQQIRQELSKLVASRGIVIEETPLRKLDLPQNLRRAVEQKLQAEQQSEQTQFEIQKQRQQLQFDLEKARSEAERKQIEANGVAKAQRIISQGLDEKTLQLKQLEVTEKAVQAANAKVVIVGAGERNSPVTIQP